MRKRRLAGLAVPLAAVLTLTGCGFLGGSSAALGTVNVALNTDPATLDPALGRSLDDYNMSRLLFDTLTRRDANGLVGGLATSWKPVSAAEFVFNIRSGARCSGGTPITATVVADSLNRFLDPATAAPGRTLAIGSGNATITADDAASTVTIKLSKNWAELPEGLSLPQSGIVCPAGLADPKGLAAGTVKDAFSGPYAVESATPTVNYKLALREEYTAWPAFAKPLAGEPPANLILTPYTDESTRATQLLSGGLDIATFVDDNVNRFTGNSEYDLGVVNQISTYLLFNEREGSVFAGDPALRKAVAQAIDARAFSEVLTAGRGTVLTSLTSPGVQCVNTDPALLPKYDPSAASKVLRGARIRFAATTLLERGVEYIAEVLRKAGADVQLSVLDNANWSTTTTRPGGWDMTVQGDVNVVGTLTSSLLRVMGPPAENGGRNKTGVVNEEGYGAVEQALSTTDPTERCAQLRKAQESMFARVDAVPLSTTAETLVTPKGFSMGIYGDYIDQATVRVTGGTGE